MTYRALGALLIGIATASGCAHVEVDRYSKEMVAGIPYSLPRKTFTLSVEYELKACEVKHNQVTIVIAKRPTVVATLEPDPAHRYYIPYSSLRNPLKNIDVTVQNYPNQTLKSINATVEDKTGAAVTAALGTALRLASLVGPVALIEKAVKGPKVTYCTPEATFALEQIKKIKASAQKPDDGGKKTGTKNEDAKPAGAKPAGAKPDDAKTDDAAKDQPKAAADDAEQVERFRQILTKRYMVSWTPQRKKCQSKPAATSGCDQSMDDPSLKPDPADLKTWLTKEGLDIVNSQSEATPLEVSMHFYPAQEPPTEADVGEIVTPMAAVVMRQPMYGVLRVCEGKCPEVDPGKQSTTATTRVLKEEAHAVPQLGHMFTMPLKNRVFENQTLTLELAEDGVVTKIGYKSNATVDAALTSFNGDLDAILKAKAAQDKAKSDAAAAAQSAAKDEADRIAKENKAISECLEAQAAVRKNGGTPTGVCQ